MEPEKTPARWLLLIHQIPPKPQYFRVKVGRRLQRLGAVAIKNSVYALPYSDGAYEDLQWLLREIVREGGDASLCDARFLDGLDDAAIESLFNEARDADYAEIAEEAKQLAATLAAIQSIDGDVREQHEPDLERMRRRFGEVAAIDFFGARGRVITGGLIASLEERLAPPTSEAAESPGVARAEYRGRTWVTRKGIYIDRMASAWLIRRFIDADARFKFVVARGYLPEPGELRFDMFEAEFTHDGDQCTFEVLLARFHLDDPGLRAIAEIVHDIDLKDAKFGRPDTLGVAQLVAGIAMAHKEDEKRLERACAAFDDLHEYLRRKRPPRGGTES